MGVADAVSMAIAAGMAILEVDWPILAEVDVLPSQSKS
jgi:hypothetical protein